MTSRYINPRTRNFDWYLESIKRLGGVFDKLEVFDTSGDTPPPEGLYQYRAATKLAWGDDDAYEGLGWSPLSAVRDLYQNFKKSRKNPPYSED